MITLLLSAMIDSQYSFLLIDCNIGYSLLPSVISFAWLGAGHTFLLFLLPYWLLFLRHTRWFFLIFTTSKHWATPGLSSLFKLVSLVISSSLMTLDTIYMLMTQKFMSAAWIYPNFYLCICLLHQTLKLLRRVSVSLWSSYFQCLVPDPGCSKLPKKVQQIILGDAFVFQKADSESDTTLSLY